MTLRTGIWSRTVALIDAFESAPWGTGTLLLLLGATIAVRNLFEVVVPRNPVFEGLAAFVHYPLAYVGPFVALTLTLAAWGRVAPARVARLMALAWLLTLVPPAADLVLHAGQEKPTIGYLQADPADLGYVWTRFFDPRVALTGTTPGIRIETLAAVALAAVYVGLRTRSALRAAGASLTVYVVSLFFFSLPALVTLAFRRLDPTTTMDSLVRGDGALFRSDTPDKADMLPILWLVPLLLGLGLLWRALERRHAGGRLLPSPAPAPRDRGDAVLLAGVVPAGALTALSLHFPVGVPVLFAPYDFFGLATAPLAMWLLARAALDLAPADRVRAAWSAAGALLLMTGLGRSASLALLAGAAFLVPSGLALLDGPRARLARVVALPAGALCAFLAGYALVIGPEGPGRVPFASATLVLFSALGYALTGLVSGRAWVDALALALPLAVACTIVGQPLFAVVALVSGGGAALVGWGASTWREPAARPVSAVALTVVTLALTRGLLAMPAVHDPWSKAATCVPRLDVIRGEELERRGQWPAAEGAFRRALECNPDYVDGLRALAVGMLKHFQEAKFEKAAPYLEKAVRLAPRSVPDLVNLGAVYIQWGRPADALPLLDRALALDPANLDALANRAQALEDLARKEEARTAWRLYIERASRYPGQAETVAQARRHLRAL